jgi:transcriptional regulator with GAF, ATPase, and Fis domain
MELPRDLRDDLERLNRLLTSQRVLSTKLEAIAELVQRVVPGCDAASIAMIVEESSLTGASSSQLAIEADLVQYQQGEGPCLTAAQGGSTVRIDALHHDERFEHFAPGAIEVGVESVLSVPLSSDGEVVGSINLYSTTAHAFSDDVPGLIADLSSYAVALIVGSSVHEATVDVLARLIEVIDDSAQVEIAIGLLIVRRNMSAGPAWEHLQALATDAGVSIVERARALIAEHELNLRGPRSSDGGG